MAKYCILLAALVVGGFAFPTRDDDFLYFNDDMEIFFDRTMEGPEGRIIGGTTAAEGAYPWMVALTAGTTRAFFCGGSLITTRYVLTAAHCVETVAVGSFIGPSFRMTVGTNRWNSGGVMHTARNSVVHDYYNPWTLKNDIGFFQTSSAVALNTRVRTIPINYNNVGANVPVRVAGWGRTSYGGAGSATLLELRTSTVDGARCRSEITRVAQQMGRPVPPLDPAIEICTFLANNRGNCHGDSGSGLVQNSNNQLVGVVSWAIPCARGAPDVYVRLGVYRTWIRRVTR